MCVVVKSARVCYGLTMPLPLQENVLLPKGFDENIHCGSTTRRIDPETGQKVACMAKAGFGTDHIGQGRCKFHGGATPLIHGRESKVQRLTILDRVDQMARDPELISLDKTLAVLRVQFEMQMRQWASQGEAYEELMNIIESQLEEGGVDAPIEIPESLMPKLDMATIDMMTKITRTIFEMRFSKRFSMPLTQVQQILLSLMDEFGRICMKYGIPNEARAEFAKQIRSLRAVGTPVDDPQLALAGGEQPSYIDGEAREAS